jgi:hypothetical protein
MPVLEKVRPIADAKQELRDVASALRQVAALMQTMPPGPRVEIAIKLYQSLEERLDQMAMGVPG